MEVGVEWGSISVTAVREQDMLFAWTVVFHKMRSFGSASEFTEPGKHY